jgi:hypothetical protein
MPLLQLPEMQFCNIDQSCGRINADMVYYLPTSSRVINGTAKVIVIKDRTGTVQSAHPGERPVDTSVNIIHSKDKSGG